MKQNRKKKNHSVNPPDLITVQDSPLSVGASTSRPTNTYGCRSPINCPIEGITKLAQKNPFKVGDYCPTPISGITKLAQKNPFKVSDYCPTPVSGRRLRKRPPKNGVGLLVSKVGKSRIVAAHTSTPKAKQVSEKTGRALGCSGISVLSRPRFNPVTLRKAAQDNNAASLEAQCSSVDSSKTICNLSLEGLPILPSNRGSPAESNIQDDAICDSGLNNVAKQSAKSKRGNHNLQSVPDTPVPDTSVDTSVSIMNNSKRKRPIVFDLADASTPSSDGLENCPSPPHKKRKTDSECGSAVGEPVVTFNPGTIGLPQNKRVPVFSRLGCSPRFGTNRIKRKQLQKAEWNGRIPVSPSKPVFEKPKEELFLDSGRKIGDNFVITIAGDSSKSVVKSPLAPTSQPDKSQVAGSAGETAGKSDGEAAKPKRSDRVRISFDVPTAVSNTPTVVSDAPRPAVVSDAQTAVSGAPTVVSSKLTPAERRIFDKTIEITSEDESDSSSDIIIVEVTGTRRPPPTSPECDVIFVAEKKERRRKSPVSNLPALREAHRLALLEAERVNRLVAKQPQNYFAKKQKLTFRQKYRNQPSAQNPNGVMYFNAGGGGGGGQPSRPTIQATRDTNNPYAWNLPGPSRAAHPAASNGLVVGGGPYVGGRPILGVGLISGVGSTSGVAPTSGVGPISNVGPMSGGGPIATAMCSSPGSSVFGSNVYNPSSVPRQTTGLRPIIIDGSNVAMSHGNNAYFSCKGLEICINYFLKKGHKVYAFVPLFRRSAQDTVDVHILDKLAADRTLIFTPSRTIEGYRAVPYDDRYIVQCAAEKGGVIVSKDNFRDLVNENPNFADTIYNRLLMYTWVEDMLMFPQDPHGRRGPDLDTLLRF